MHPVQDFDEARREAVFVVARVLQSLPVDAGLAEEVAANAVDALIYDRPDLVYLLSEHASRFWYWRKERREPRIWPLVFFGGDEFFNRTVAVRIPFSGTLIAALNVPLRRVPVPSSVEFPDDWIRRSRPSSVLERYGVRDVAVRVVRPLRAYASRVRRSV